MLQAPDSGFFIVGYLDEGCGAGSFVLKTDQDGYLSWREDWEIDFHIRNLPLASVIDGDELLIVVRSSAVGYPPPRNIGMCFYTREGEKACLWEELSEVSEYQFHRDDLTYIINLNMDGANHVSTDISKYGSDNQLLFEKIVTSNNQLSINDVEYIVETTKIDEFLSKIVFQKTSIVNDSLTSIIDEEESEIMGRIAEKNQRCFYGIADYMIKHNDPSVYIEELSEEWNSLGEKLQLKPEDFPLELFTKIFEADELHSTGQLGEGVLASFKSLSETTFWYEFWTTPALQSDLDALSNKFRELGDQYEEETLFWSDYHSKTVDDYSMLLEHEKHSIA